MPLFGKSNTWPGFSQTLRGKTNCWSIIIYKIANLCNKISKGFEQ